jgi:hypothetical protein
MSSKNKKSFKNAEDVIERFGGIRPMSTKTGIPVTTIQGWKKRDSIPPARVDDIIKAADKNDITMGGLILEAGAKSTVKTTAGATSASPQDKPVRLEKAAPDAKASQPDEAALPQGIAPRPEASKEQPTPAAIDNLEERLAKVEQSAITKSAMISVVIVLLMIGAVTLLLWPKAKEVDEQLDNNNAQISELEGQVEDMREGGAFMGGLIPQEWKDQLGEYTQQATELKEQAVAAKETVGAAIKRAEEISNDVIGAEAGNLEQRIARLEAHVGEIVADPNMAYFMDKLKSMQGSAPGQNAVDSTVSELLAAMNNFTGSPDMLNGYLDQMRQQQSAMGQTFDGLPSEDLKAAALLLTMEQFRGALNRDGAAFEDDLALMKNFVGEDNNELNAALDKLAPRAQDGVLSIEGLSKEFRGLAGEAVVSSLKGEDVDFKDKATARMNELFSFEKEDEMVTGTDTQGSLAKVQHLLDAGELEAAIAEAESLEGPEAETLAPWLEEAKATSAAQDVSNILGYNIDMRVPDSANMDKAVSGAADAIRPQGRMIEDPKSGLKIYLPSQSMFDAKPMAAPKGLNAQ